MSSDRTRPPQLPSIGPSCGTLPTRCPSPAAAAPPARARARRARAARGPRSRRRACATRTASQSSESSLVRYSHVRSSIGSTVAPAIERALGHVLAGRVQGDARLVARRARPRGWPRRTRPASPPGSVARRRSACPPATGARGGRRGRSASPARSQSHATRYQRRPRLTRLCGSTQRRLSVAVAAAVGEAQALAVAAGAGDRGERLGVDRRPARGGRSTVAGCSALTRRRRCDGQDLLELDERAHRGLLDPGHRRAGGGPQADRDRDRLVVVEQQRRHRRAGVQPVAAGRTGDRVDRIAELAQALDVAADRAARDVRGAGRAPRRASRGASAAARAA